MFCFCFFKEEEEEKRRSVVACNPSVMFKTVAWLHGRCFFVVVFFKEEEEKRRVVRQMSGKRGEVMYAHVDISESSFGKTPTRTHARTYIFYHFSG